MSKDKICTADNPAPSSGNWSYSVVHSRNWNRDWDHPDVDVKEMDGDYEDYRVTCKHCGQSKIVEGPDA